MGFFISAVSSLALLLFAPVYGQPYSNCGADSYYSQFDGQAPDSWSRDELAILLKATHRKYLPYTDKYNDDVWKALIDLDGGNNGETVHLIYRDIDIPAEPHGTPSTWNREHLWPKSHGVHYEGKDFTDIHHLKPADWNVNAARNNKFFGYCQDQETCRSPAHSEAAPDTATDSQRFLPPEAVRGDIARMLMYMAVRYSGSVPEEENLILTDCPGQDNEMGYLSDLLEWHDKDPVSDTERARNDRACERWQGNRNPFVDYPELVDVYFRGQPDVGCGEGPAPDDETPNNSSNDANECSALGPGSVMITRVNTDNPDVIEMVALKDIPAGANLHMTDNAWTGNGFRSNEGTLKVSLV